MVAEIPAVRTRQQFPLFLRARPDYGEPPPLVEPRRQTVAEPIGGPLDHRPVSRSKHRLAIGLRVGPSKPECSNRHGDLDGHHRRSAGHSLSNADE